MRSGKRNDIKEQQEEDDRKNSSTATIPLGTTAYSKWAGRFTWTAIIQGAIVALLTAMLAAFVATTGYPTLLVQAMLSTPQVGFSEITALAGLGLYLVVGVIGTGLTAQFYHHFEIRAGKPYKGIVTTVLAWTHLVLMNLGIAAASLLMIYAGYLGDIAVGEKEAGGFGMTIEEVSEQILNQFIVPVSSLLLITVVGSIAGGAGFIINQFQRRHIQTQEIGGGKRRA
ncbi:MAG: hypothetical protein M3299_14815 [Thermoproteota archaeon]|nr:hypothetical protein [Thermoproteota archaeon]